MPVQLDIFQAAAAGEAAMTACFSKASRLDPDFKDKAQKAILAHLNEVKQAPGETLTHVAKQAGAVPHNDKAFGAIFQSMARGGLIRKMGYCPRAHGHGAPGPVWGINL